MRPNVPKALCALGLAAAQASGATVFKVEAF